MASHTLITNEERWRRNDLDYSEELRIDFGIAVVLVIGGLVLLTLVVPRIDIPKIDTDNIPAGDFSEIRDSLGFEPPTLPSSVFDDFNTLACRASI